MSMDVERCPECGGRYPPSVARPWHAIGHELKGKIIAAMFGCFIASWCALCVPLSIAAGSYEFFLCAVLITMVGMLITGVWILVSSAKWISLTLDAIWSARDVGIGPWSGLFVRMVIYLVLFGAQCVLAALMFKAVHLIPADYPGGWL